MKKFIWILVFLIIAGGIGLAIYANRHKSTVTTGSQELGSVLGDTTETNNGTTTDNSAGSALVPTDNTTSGSTSSSSSTSSSTTGSTGTGSTTTSNTGTNTGSNSSTGITSTTRSSGSPAVVTPTTKTYLIPDIGLQITVPLSWYEFSSSSVGSLIGFYNQAGTVQYGSIEVFQSGFATDQQLQNDLLSDGTISDVRPTTYNSASAYSFIKSGESGRITAFVHNGDVYYLRGQVLTQAKLKFNQ